MSKVLKDRKADVPKSKSEVFENSSVFKAVMTMVIPTVISQVINVIYNLADTWFVGRTGDPDAVAAVSICMPVYLIMTAVSNLFGIGGASVIGRAQGMGDTPKARQAFATAFWCSGILAAGYSLLILVIHPKLLWLIGGNADNIELASGYMLITIVLGGIPTILAAATAHLIRATGHSQAASIGMTTGALLNILLDPLLMFVIFPKGHEVLGAAVATAASNLVSFLFFIIYILKHRDNGIIDIRPVHVCRENAIIWEEAKCGAPSFLMLSVAMCSNFVLNPTVATLGSHAMAGLGITRKLDGLAHGVNQGVTQGMLPLVAYCYSAGQKKRMRDVVLLSTAITFTFSLTSTILSRVFAQELISFFIREPATIEMGASFLRILSSAVPVYSITFVIIAVFQAMGRTREPFLLSILHKGTIDILFIRFIFHRWGAQYAPLGNVLSECITLVLALILFVRVCRKSFWCCND